MDTVMINTTPADIKYHQPLVNDNENDNDNEHLFITLDIHKYHSMDRA